MSNVDHQSIAGYFEREVMRLEADNAKLRALLGKLRWESIEKDNMEWRCETTVFVIDEIRAALAHEKEK